MPPTEFNLIYLIDSVKKYFKYILGITLLTTILGFVYSLPTFYKPQFLSDAVIYPIPPDRFDASNIFDGSIYLYGGVKDVEKLANLAESETVAMYVIDSLNLWKAYGISETGESPKFYVREEFRSNFAATKVEGNGLRISAYDTDPKRAADIVNLAIRKINEMNRSSLDVSKKQSLKIYQDNHQKLTLKYNEILDSVRIIRQQYNVFNQESQTEILLEQLLSAQGRYETEKSRLDLLQKNGGSDSAVLNTRARMKGAEAQVRMLTGNGSVSIEKFGQGLDKLISYEQRAFTYADEIKYNRIKIDRMRSISEGKYDTIVILDEAKPSDKKARPVRGMILIVSFLLGLVGSIMAVITIDRLRMEIVKQRSEA